MGPLSTKVMSTLERVPETRNDDALLVIEIYNYYYKLQYNLKIDKLLQIMRDCKPDEIIRVRRRFNQHGKYLATDPFVLKKRNQKINKMRKELGYKQLNIIE